MLTIVFKERAGRQRLLGVALLALFLFVSSLMVLNAPAQTSDADDPPVLEGTIVKITQIGTDWFFHIDLDADGEGDVWIKVVGIIVDLNGTEVDSAEVAVGTPLQVIDYLENDVGFAEAFEIVLLIESDPITTEPGREGQATFVNVFARIPGAPRPTLDLFGTDRDAWICLDDSVELYWVTTPDVSLINLGETLGTFRADLGGVINGLNWGSVTASPRDTISYQISAVDGNFQAGGAATVSVFKSLSQLGPLESPEASFFPRLKGISAASDASDDWLSSMPSTRFTPRVGIIDIRPVGSAVQPGAIWQIRNTAEDGTVHNFTIAADSVYQHPFRAEGTFTSIPVSGNWTFTTVGEVTDKTIEFMVRPLCD